MCLTLIFYWEPESQKKVLMHVMMMFCELPMRLHGCCVWTGKKKKIWQEPYFPNSGLLFQLKQEYFLECFAESLISDQLHFYRDIISIQLDQVFLVQTSLVAPSLNPILEYQGNEVKGFQAPSNIKFAVFLKSVSVGSPWLWLQFCTELTHPVDSESLKK